MSSNYFGDLYPSRYRELEQIFCRMEPVVYADESTWNTAPAPLSVEYIAFYQRNGYLLLEDFFGADQLSKLMEDASKVCSDKMLSRRDEVIREPKASEIRSIFDVHRFSKVLRDVVSDTKLTDVVSYLLDSQVYLHQCRLNYKPGFKGKDFYWHSDFETWHVEDGMPSMRAMSVSIALTENYAYNGPVMIIPGSQRYFISCTGFTPQDNFRTSLRQQEYGIPTEDAIRRMINNCGIEIITCKPGAVLLFDCNTLHGSASNISPFARNNLFVVYNAVVNSLRSPYCDRSPRPEFVAHRLNISAINSAWSSLDFNTQSEPSKYI